MVNPGQIRVWSENKKHRIEDQFIMGLKPDSVIFISDKDEGGICTIILDDGSTSKRPDWMIELYSSEKRND